MKLIPSLLAGAALTLSLGAFAQETVIRKALSDRIPQLEKIDEVRSTPMQGLYE
ncbi:MAG: DsbC family protein, partial [Xanthomonas perforans]|nr:DsbC family protein [Xanthomonas perforans]